MMHRLIFILILVISTDAGAFFFKQEEVKVPVKTTLAILPPENLPPILSYFEQDRFLNSILEQLYTKPYFRVLEFRSLPEIVGDKNLFAQGFQKDAYLKVIKELGAEYLLVLNVDTLQEKNSEKEGIRQLTLNLEGRLIRFLTGEIMAISKIELVCSVDDHGHVQIRKQEKSLRDFASNIHDEFKVRMKLLQSSYEEL